VKLGIAATEAPPHLGGMEEYASHLIVHLSRRHEVTCLVREHCSLDVQGGRCSAVLTRDLTQDLPHLAALDVDVILALNGGIAAAASRLRPPLAVVVYGNDFLNPWVGFRQVGDAWLSQAPLLWRWAPQIRESRRRRALGAGLRQSRAVIAISRATATRVQSAYRLSHARIHVVPPGVGESFFGVMRADRPRDVVQILTVARLTKAAARKNIDGVLGAIARLGASVPIRYTVVGDGDDRERLMSLAERLGIMSQVTFTGRVSLERLEQFYGASDLFVMAPTPSDRDIEGFGLVYIEASAAGVPVIASRSEGCLDAVAESENGWFVQDSSPEAIAVAIQQAIPRLSPEVSARARAFAARFRWSEVAERVSAILDDVAAAARPGSR
jgi:glycosyltransferase involved in cell wall biosynthesis